MVKEAFYSLIWDSWIVVFDFSVFCFGFSCFMVFGLLLLP